LDDDGLKIEYTRHHPFDGDVGPVLDCVAAAAATSAALSASTAVTTGSAFDPI
jgi:hypothetical protein